MFRNAPILFGRRNPNFTEGFPNQAEGKPNIPEGIPSRAEKAFFSCKNNVFKELRRNRPKFDSSR